MRSFNMEEEDPEIPLFEEVLEKNKKDLFDSGHYRYFKEVKCSELYVKCKKECNEKEDKYCLNVCEDELKNCNSVGTTLINNNYTELLSDLYESQKDHIFEVLNNNNTVYRSISVKEPKKFIEELQKYGKTNYQCDKNVCEKMDYHCAKNICDMSENLKGIGVYWTPYEESAEAYWGEDNGIEVIVSAKLKNPKSIDVENTLLIEMLLNLDEKEVRLYENQEIEVFKIKYDDPKLNEYVELEGNWKAFT